MLDGLVGEEGFEARLRTLSSASAMQPYLLMSLSGERLFPQLTIAAAFPPTFLAHGDADYVDFLCESEDIHIQPQCMGDRGELHIVLVAGHGLLLGPWLSVPVNRIDLGFESLTRELAV